MYDLVIIEDEANVREGLLYLFPWDSIGFRIAAAFADGESALRYLHGGGADAVLTDICMPGVDGIELAKRLRDSRNDIPVVFLTGYRDFQYAQQAVKCGVKDFLLKPVKHNDLMLAFLKIREELDARKGAAADNSPKGYNTQVIEDVKRYIKASLQTATLEDAAVMVHLSSGYLSRLFREKTGETFSDCLLRCRMERAAELLRGTDQRTYEISDAVGYDSPRNFTRAFKRYFGVTPREYKGGRERA